MASPLRVAACAAALATGFMAVAPAMAETIRCESTNGRERYCPANIRGGVTLQTQLSGSGCYQGDTWGYDNRGIWVSGGCRADFWTGGYQGNNYHSSNDYYGYNNNNQSRSKNNDGATAAIAIGAILGAALIASAASKDKGSSGGNSQYQTYFDRGCDAGRGDRNSNQSSFYGRHRSSFNDRNEQAFAAGYNQCWSKGR